LRRGFLTQLAEKSTQPPGLTVESRVSSLLGGFVQNRSGAQCARTDDVRCPRPDINQGPGTDDTYRPGRGEAGDARYSQREPSFGLAVSEAHPRSGHDQKPSDAWQSGIQQRRECRGSPDFVERLPDKLPHTHRDDAIGRWGRLWQW
jgi:hypothetical protein